MKKKLISLCAVVALAAVAVGGTLAYFTDKDAETNNFSVGNVDIRLDETFVQDSELMPGMDVNKDAKIVNDGDNEAYVWAEVLIPAALDDADDNSPAAPGLGNSLHVNFLGAYAKEYAQNTDANAKFYNADLSKLWVMQYNEKGVASYGYLGTETIDGVVYNKYIKLYIDTLAKGEETSLFLDKVYMDSKVKQVMDADGKPVVGKYILVDGTTYTGEWNIVVRAYGIQAEGFDNVVDAWKAYDGK